MIIYDYHNLSNQPFMMVYDYLTFYGLF